MQLETAAFLGFVTGIVHHVIFQYPNQKGLLTTLSGFGVLEVTFLAIMLNERALSIVSYCLFTTVYVPLQLGTLF